MKLNYIDSIRGIAILMVILVHVSQNVNLQNKSLIFLTNYGQLGVQLFFVASAYTLCLSSEKRKNETNHNIKFAIRRYFRIAPAYYLGILIYFIIELLVNKIVLGKYIVPEKYNFMNVFSNVLFFHGFYEPGNNTIVPGGWSIGTEMAFYCLFPILFMIAVKTIKSFKNIIFLLIIGIFISLSVIFIFYLNGILITKYYFLYFNLINQLPVFLIGMSYYFFKEHLKKDWNHSYDIHFFIFFSIITFLLFSKNLNFLFTISSAFSYIFLIEIFKKNDFLNSKLLIKIGQVSFSMYLLHFVFAYHFTPFFSSKLHIQGGFIALIIFYIFTICATFFSSLIFEKIIEKPGIKLGNRLIKTIN